VTGLNAFVGGLEGGKEGRGERMGRFRSRGQMGRALGPLSGELSSFCRFGGLERGTEGTRERDLTRFFSPSSTVRLTSNEPACALYWVLGPSACYASAGLALSAVAWSTRSLVEMEAKEKASLKKKVA